MSSIKIEHGAHQSLNAALGVSSLPNLYQDESAFITFRPGCLTVVFSFSEPGDLEKMAFGAGHPLKVGLFKNDEIGFLMFDFAKAFIFDAPFHGGAENPENLESFFEFVIRSPRSQTMSLLLVGVDASNGDVIGTRLVTLSKRISALFVRMVLDQAMRPISHDTLTAGIEHTYQNYRSVLDMRKKAVAMDKAG